MPETLRKLTLSFCGVLLALGISACGKVVQVGQYGAVVSDFVQMGQSQGRNIVIDDLIIKDAVLEADVAADCLTGVLRTPTVRVNSTLIHRISPVRLKVILYHELGHCVLKRGHTSAQLRSGIPASIMHPNHVSGLVFEKNKQYYVKELFSENRGAVLDSTLGVTRSTVRIDEDHSRCSHHSE